jgi:RNA polymerase sigma factor (sigma-70 family)
VELLEEKKLEQRAKQRIVNIRKWRREVVRKRLSGDAKVIYWAVRKLLPKRASQAVVQDFAADLTVWVLSKAHQYDRHKGSFTTWLHWQARAVLAERARGLAREARRASFYTESDFVEDVAEDRVADVGSLMEQAEANRRLAHRLIKIVPKQERNVYKLYLEGKSFREISQMTKWSRQTIINRFAKLAKLARQAGIDWAA